VHIQCRVGACMCGCMSRQITACVAAMHGHVAPMYTQHEALLPQVDNQCCSADMTKA
jgi:hypothetical protein